jgi:hypothetical protein
MKKIISSIVLLMAMSSFASNVSICDDVESWHEAECTKLTAKSTFEKIPVEFCQYRIPRGELLECYKAVENKTYDYAEILECVPLHHADIVACLEESGLSTL